ncbi:MAG TPA: ATP-binding protein [Holophagaceae bacterium]|nr:ATP-binding protein [Holophagaceae bacterium]
MNPGRSLLLGALLGWGVVAPAQGPGRMVVRSYGQADGIPESRINAMIQDRQGRYWVAGDMGVYVGDGSVFLKALPTPVDARPLFKGLVEDAEGGIYVVGEAGLWHLQDDRWTRLGEGLPERSTGEPLGLFKDGAGDLWLQWGAYLLRLEGPGRYRAVPLPQEGLAVLSPRVHEPGLLLRIGPRAWCWRQDTWHPLPEVPVQRAEEYRGPIQEDRTGTLWTGTYLRIFRLDSGARAWVEQPDPDGNHGFAGGTSSPGGVTSPGGGEVWAMGDQAARRLDRAEPTLETNPTFSTYSMTLLLRDREGHLWVDRDGLHRLGGPWRQHGALDGLPVAGIWQALRDAQGHMWVSTTKGLFRALGSRWERIWEAGLHAQIALGADGCLWATERLSGRVLRFPTQGATPHPAPPLPDLRGLEALRGVSATGRFLAFPTRDRTFRVGRWEGGRWTWQVIPTDGPPTALRTYADALGNLHLVMKDGGGQILHRTPEGPWRPLPLAVGRDVTELFSTAEDTLVAVQFMPPELHTFQLKGEAWTPVGHRPLEPLSPCKTAYGAAVLDDGRTWVITDHGVLELDPRHPEWARHYTTPDGLPVDDCNQFGLLVEPSKIWISTGTGLASFDRQAERPLPELPAPFLLGARVGEAAWTLSLPRELPPDTRTFSLQIGIASPGRRDHLRYQWQDLERSGEWHQFEAPTLTFLDPSPGIHRIRVRALEPGDHPSPEWRYTVRVLRPWWQRGWALALWTGLAVALALWLHRARLRRIEARNEELAALVAERTAALAASEERERAASRAKSAFLADMSHELRTPLNAILLYSELIRQDAEEAGHESLTRDSDHIHASGRHLLSLINGILDLSKVEAGKMQLHLATVALRPLMQEVVDTLGPLAQQQEDHLLLELEEELSLHTDELKLKQVLINLAGNAIKFTEGGTVTLAATREAGGIHLQVQDTGVGLTPEQIDRLFQAYEQAPRGVGAGGTGLGLTISKRFVELLGGRIEVTSEPGRGSTFHIHLPASREPVNPDPDSARPPG